ncbi:hypothetical protein CR513_50693, partial [Mucuna pruriens]
MFFFLLYLLSNVVVDSIVVERAHVFMLGFFGLWKNCELLLQWIFGGYIWSMICFWCHNITSIVSTFWLCYFTLVVLGRVKLVISIESVLGVGHYNGFMKNWK